MKNRWLYFSLVINLSALWRDLTALKFSFTWVQRKGPQDPPKYGKMYIFSYFGFKFKKFLSDCFLIWHVHRYGWEDSWKARYAQSEHWTPPQGPPNSLKYNLVLTFWLVYEKLVFKLFPLVVDMSPLWWGLHLLICRCPCYPWILCMGPTWDRHFFIIFVFIFVILTQKVLVIMLLYLTCKLLLKSG